MSILESPESRKVAKRVDDWKQRLIDLTKRNKAVYFQPTKTSHLTVASPNMETVFNRLVLRGKDWEILQPPVTKYGESFSKPRSPKSTEIVLGWSDPGQLDRALKNLSRRSVSEYSERGIRVLHVAFGHLKWKEKDTNQEVLSPLLLTPVELVKETTRKPFRIKVPPVEDILIVNPALKLKLRYEYGVELPDLIEDDEQTLSTYLVSVDNIVKSLGWIVEPATYLGLFSFSKLAIYQDLTDNLKKLVEHPLVKALTGISVKGLINGNLPKIEELDTIVNPNNTYQILDADSSQQLCIQYALRGQSFVMHGPPGTGKSQTIANIISEYIAAGKSVLFVSEKMAALEVVYSRLKDKNLDEYCLELHSYKANKREVINELTRALTEHLKAGKGLSDDDIEKLIKCRVQLNEYVDSIHRIRPPSNLSAYQVLDKITSLGSVPILPFDYREIGKVNQNTLSNLEDKVKRLSNSWVVVEEGTSFPWKGCKTDKYSTGIRTEWINLLTTLIDYTKQIRYSTYDFCDNIGIATPKNLDEYDSVQKLANILSSTPYPPVKWLQDADLSRIRYETLELSSTWENYWTIRNEIEKRYDNRFRAFPTSTSKVIEDAWISAAELLHPNTKGDGGFLGQFDELMKCIDDALLRIDVWDRLIKEISDTLGISFETNTINIAKRLERIVQLCESTNKPERSWLDKSTLDEVREYHRKISELYRKRNDFINKLTEYNDKVTSLDLDKIIAYLKGPGSSFLRYFRPSYYQILDELKAVSIKRIIPNTVLSDLQVVKELKETLDVINSEEDESKKRLGSYFRNGNPDFEGVEEAIKVANEVLRQLGSPRAPKALRDNLCIGTKPKEELLVKSKELSDSLQSWLTSNRRLRGIMPDTQVNSRTSILELPLPELKELISLIDTRLHSLIDVTLPVLVTSISTRPNSFNQLIGDLKKSAKLQSFEEDESGKALKLKEIYGGLYDGISTDWNRVLNALDWTQIFLKSLPLKPSFSLISLATNSGLERPNLAIEDRHRQILNIIVELNSRFEKPIWSKRIQSLSPDEILVASGIFLSRIDDLQSWVDFNETRANLENEGLGKFVNQLIEKRYDKDLLVDIYRKSLYIELLGHFFEEDAHLKSFRGKDHDQIVENFRALDIALIDEAPKKVIETANINKPQSVFVEASDSEITILLREAAKKRRQMPLRQLFDRIPNLIRRLKPCLLMSPISVSQFIFPERLHFDLVIFDEASQICTEDAIGSIYRGNTLIVAGDNKQLPPTPFFQFALDDDAEWDDSRDNIGVFESVLDECMGIGLPVSMLRWHYRSKHDSLIKFSNNEFYDGRLVLFPSAIHRGSNLGIEFVHVSDGIYDRGGSRNNPREAEVIADIVFKHFTEHPSKSLGVMTFSISQMNTVKDEIDERLSLNPQYEKFIHDDRLSGFFIKNLENVQGDERDVMIISVGYGFDTNGTMTMNFGPLNLDGGERRLNVAITRAREKVILVSSIKSSDIDLLSTKSIGVRCLHDYLDYAERASETEMKSRKNLEDVSEIAKEIADEVRKLGYIAILDVGESSLKVDIGVRMVEDPDKFILGIILDGEYYRDTMTARDRDRLRVQVLEKMGWKIHRIWSPEWVQRRASEAARLKEVLEKIEVGEQQEKPIKQKTLTKPMKIEHQKVVERSCEKLPGSESYQMAVLKPEQTFENMSSNMRSFLHKRYRQEIRHLLPKLVKIEGPIHVDHAYKRINKAVKIPIATSSIHNIYLDTVTELASKGKVIRNGPFLWPELGNVTIRVRVPNIQHGEDNRSIEYIASEEIQSAMKIILKHSMGLSKESLIQETSEIFKVRQTLKTKRILELAIEDMIRKKSITMNANVLTLTI